jgi:hypothetical protein
MAWKSLPFVNVYCSGQSLAQRISISSQKRKGKNNHIGIKVLPLLVRFEMWGSFKMLDFCSDLKKYEENYSLK